MICSKCKQNKLDSFFYRRKRAKKQFYSECIECFKRRVATRHKDNKDILVDEFGGKCSHCNYDRCKQALTFHHIDPSSKSFTISSKGSLDISLLRMEAKKCILLCLICHAEKHAGLW